MWSKRACLRVQLRWNKQASAIVDSQEELLQDEAAANKFKTDLTDSLRLSEDAGQNWRETWENEERLEHESHDRTHQKMEDWSDGNLKAGSRESARDRDERRYTSGTMPSNSVPPHPPEFESMVRRVRYAHLMPMPEPPPPLEHSLYLSESFPLLTSLVDRLKELPQVNIEYLERLPIEKHDLLIAESFAQVVPEADEPMLEGGDVEPALLEDSYTHNAEEETVEVAEVEEERKPDSDEVFAGQNKLTDYEEVGRSVVSTPAATSAPRPVRMREKALTASQTLVAVATQCEETVEEIFPSVLLAVGRTGDIDYVKYYWGLAKKVLDPEDKDTAKWAAYIRALSHCKGAVKEAYEAVEQMKSLGITPCINTWNALMLSYINNYDHESALKVADNIRMFANLSPNHETFLFTMLAHKDDMTQDREANARRAMNVMYEMTQVYRMEPTRRHYEVLLETIKYIASDNEWYIEMQTYAQQMKHLGMPWTSTVYAHLMWVEGVRGDVDKIRELFVTMRRRKLPATDRVYSAILLGYSESVPLPLTSHPRDIHTWTAKQKQRWESDHDTPPPLEEWRKRMYQEGLTIFNLAKKHPTSIPRTRYNLLTMVAKLNPAEFRRVWEEEGKPHVKEYPRLYNRYIMGLLILHDNGDLDALDDAEEAFAEATMQSLRLPKGVYTGLMLAHIRTAREGSVDIALDYMSALERSGQTMSSGAAHAMKRLIDEMGPKRDALRRAKALMERRNKLSNTLYPEAAQEGTTPTLNYPGEAVHMEGLSPDGFAFPSSETGLNPDGTLAGEGFEDRKAALAQMGYQPMHIENSATLRSGTKVNDWLAYSAANPSTTDTGHASFDKVLQNNTQVGADTTFTNEWHRQRMAAHPEAYKSDGTIDTEGEKVRTDEDDPARMLLAMERRRMPADDFDVEQPYFSKTFAHTAHDPTAWTPDQESFMSNWLKSSSGKLHSVAMKKSRNLRASVLNKRQERNEKYPDEL